MDQYNLRLGFRIMTTRHLDSSIQYIKFIYLN